MSNKGVVLMSFPRESVMARVTESEILHNEKDDEALVRTGILGKSDGHWRAFINSWENDWLVPAVALSRGDQKVGGMKVETRGLITSCTFPDG